MYSILLSNVRAVQYTSLACDLICPVTMVQVCLAEVPNVFDIRVPKIGSSATYGIPRTSVDVSQAPSAIALDLFTFRRAPDAAEYVSGASRTYWMSSCVHSIMVSSSACYKYRTRVSFPTTGGR
jgi:hypothetical protein